MTDTQTQQAADSDRAKADPVVIAGTVLAGICILLAGVVLLDVALGGRILGPVFARWAGPPPAEAPEAETIPAAADVDGQVPGPAAQDAEG